MTEREFRNTVRELLEERVEDLAPEQKAALVRLELVDYQRGQEFPEPNKGKPWTDDQLRVVLSYAPTEENTILLARAFGRAMAVSNRSSDGLARANVVSAMSVAKMRSSSNCYASARRFVGVPLAVTGEPL